MNLASVQTAIRCPLYTALPTCDGNRYQAALQRCDGRIPRPSAIYAERCDPVSASKRLIVLAGVMAATGHQVLQISVYPQARP
ncbi:hypothetical protein [Pseudomonas syringae group genomosp. 3]|uniref:hypothetical protein n=1 Tax=Pseudomonas syringae group genomosp. 3 TaxID=251701 RepID=UPI001604F1D7|nr:hypothetical protein [Pseudomonas syringae group genomosp. 3]